MCIHMYIINPYERTNILCICRYRSACMYMLGYLLPVAALPHFKFKQKTNKFIYASALPSS